MNPYLIPDRAFVATVTTSDGGRYTTIVRGPNAGEAERRAEVERPGSRVIVRQEAPIR